MSQDLFAAFNVSADIQERQDTLTHPTTAQERSKQDHSHVEAEDDDEFGEFESANNEQQVNPKTEKHEAKVKVQIDQGRREAVVLSSSKPTEKVQTGSHPFAGRMDLLFDQDVDEYDAGVDDLHDLSKNPEAAAAFSKSIIAQQEVEQRNASATNTERNTTFTTAQLTPRSHPSHGPNTNPNVLFDVEEDFPNSDDDEWGMFEGGAPVPINHRRPVESPPATVTNASGSLRAAQLPHRPLHANKGSSDGPQKMIRHDVPEIDEEWEDFEWPRSPLGPDPPLKHVAVHGIGKDSSQSAARVPDVLGPSNVPSPSILLALFPSVMAAAQEALLDPLAKLENKQQQVLLSHHATFKFLVNHIGHATVLGRIIAGRKLRWKRDQSLSQGTRIGPAASGGRKTGMKLTGIDRSELAKEDREVLDVVRQWKNQAGKLRSATTNVNTTRRMNGMTILPPLPEIAENLPVQALKSTEGGFVAPQPCTLCGLKREERVAKVDIQVNDSFGEFWLDKINMHVACKTFWDEYSAKLRSR